MTKKNKGRSSVSSAMVFAALLPFALAVLAFTETVQPSRFANVSATESPCSSLRA